MELSEERQASLLAYCKLTEPEVLELRSGAEPDAPTTWDWEAEGRRKSSAAELAGMWRGTEAMHANRHQNSR